MYARLRGVPEQDVSFVVMTWSFVTRAPPQAVIEYCATGQRLFWPGLLCLNELLQVNMMVSELVQQMDLTMYADKPRQGFA